MGQRRFVLLDRDGTIIVEKHYLSDPDGVELIAGAAEGLRQLAALGLGLVVVTNQSAIGRGFFDAARLDAIHRRMLDQLRAQDIRLEGVYFCPHLPSDGCGCRKPGTGLVEQAAAQLHFDARACFVVGDAASDVELGRAIGATTLLVRTGYGAETQARALATPDYVVNDLREAADVITGLVRATRPLD